MESEEKEKERLRRALLQTNNHNQVQAEQVVESVVRSLAPDQGVNAVLVAQKAFQSLLDALPADFPDCQKTFMVTIYAIGGQVLMNRWCQELTEKPEQGGRMPGREDPR
jgi:hypothetical protein